jgi:hypothetical protein
MDNKEVLISASEQLAHETNKWLRSIILQRIDNQVKYIRELGQFMQSTQRNNNQVEPKQNLSTAIVFKEKANELFTIIQQEISKNPFEEPYRLFDAIVENQTANLEESHLIMAPTLQIPLLENDTLKYKLQKHVYNLNTKLRAISPFTKKSKERSTAQRKIGHYQQKRLIRNAFQYYYSCYFPQETVHLFEKLFENESKNFLSLWRYEETLDENFQKSLGNKTGSPTDNKEQSQSVSQIIESIISENTVLAESLTKEAEEISQKTSKNLLAYCLGTEAPMVPPSAYSTESIAKEKQSIQREYQNLWLQWKNAHYTLLDDWAVDLEVSKLYYGVYHQYLHFLEKTNDFIETNINSNFASIEHFNQNGTTKLKQANTYNAAKIITQLKEETATQLVDKTLNESTEMLTNCFSADFDKLTATTFNLANQVSSRKGFVKNKRYDTPLRSNEIKYISPRELLDIESLPHFKEKNQLISEKIEEQLNQIRVILMSLGTVCDFNLESALLLIDTNDQDNQQAIDVAIEGFERAQNQLNTARSILNDLQTESTQKLANAIEEFNRETQKLKNNDNLFALHLEITKIKTIEKGKQLKKQALENIKTFIPKLISKGGKLVEFVQQLIYRIKKKMGVDTAQALPSFELSEFLTETEQSLKKLPFVYQRLYQILPTNEERFFVNRKNELAQLNKAFNNWQKDRFITCAVIGEKGSGTSSLVNYFLNSIPNNIEVIKHTLNEKTFVQEKYYKLMSNILNTNTFETNKEIIDFLNQQPGTRIIVLENLQHLFLKKVGGFECMKMLFDLISHTSKKVLWIGVYTPVSWSYLEKTMSISNYFTNEIFLENLSSETIREIIFKRNKLSGYQLIFIPTAEQEKNKNYQKLNNKEKHAFLQKQFFTNLFHNANGNISLAQLYWLRSTANVTNHAIEIATIGSLDFSFVKNLSGESLFALQVLLRHDGLTLEDFALAMNEPDMVCRNLLIPMLEKGLLIRPRDKFNINPLVYRHVLDYLTSRNFIH